MNPNPSIPLLTSDQTALQARFSRWISIDLLIDKQEMGDFLEQFHPFLLTTQPTSESPSFILQTTEFLKTYTHYIDCLKNGSLPLLQDFKKKFYLFITSSLEEVYQKPLASDKKSLVFNAPLIEVKPICLSVSTVDDSVRVMPLNPKGILWGLRFSFPQMIQKANSCDIKQIDSKEYPTGELFKNFRKWVRSQTLATPFIFNSKKMNLPIRLGRECFSWINKHPQLKIFNLAVSVET